MPRTKGAKDAKPRKMDENSLAQLPQKQPGMESRVLRVYGPSTAISRFGRMTSPERGRIIATAMQTTDL